GTGGGQRGGVAGGGGEVAGTARDAVRQLLLERGQHRIEPGRHADRLTSASAPELPPQIPELLFELAAPPPEPEKISEAADPHRGVGREQIREMRHATSPWRASS